MHVWCYVALYAVLLQVKEGSQSVTLPCKTKPDLPEDARVEWTRSEPEPMMVHVYTNRGDQLNTQDGLYRDRTKMNEDLLRTGDLSLTLKHPTQRDTGGYICTIHRDKDILRQKVLLQVKGLSNRIQVKGHCRKFSQVMKGHDLFFMKMTKIVTR
uniref:Ig-like domain-containing protein n=1 Tax=Amphilophus citrinellus TaxID=61819 RepID=A0A3Q0SQ51_AMPCI